MRGIPLATGYSTSAAVLIVGQKLEIDFDLSCSAGPSTVTYFIEYSEDLVTWFAEVAEENAGKGVVLMPKVIRTFADNNATNVANNTGFKVSCQFTRPHRFARIQIAAASGTVVVNSATSAFGLGPYGSVVVGSGSAPPDPCAPGQVLYDVMLPTEMTIASDSVTVGPTWGVYEIPGFGPFQNCTNFQIQITADLKVTGGGASVWAYLNVSGLDLESREFSGFHPPYNLAMAGSEDIGVYETEVFVDVNGFANTFVDFAGPLAAQSVYFWVPPKPPSFDTATYLIKNVHIRIVTI